MMVSQRISGGSGPKGKVERRVCLGAEHVVVAGGDRRGVHFELIARQRGVEPRHQDGVDGVPLQKHRRQAEGQGVVGAEAFQRRAGVEDAAIEVFRMGQQGAACLGEGPPASSCGGTARRPAPFRGCVSGSSGRAGCSRVPARPAEKFSVRLTVRKQRSWCSFMTKNSFPAAGHPYSLSIAGNRKLIKLFYQDA